MVCVITAARGSQNIPVEIPVEIQNPGRPEPTAEINARRNYLRNEFKEQVRTGNSSYI